LERKFSVRHQAKQAEIKKGWSGGLACAEHPAAGGRSVDMCDASSEEEGAQVLLVRLRMPPISRCQGAPRRVLGEPSYCKIRSHGRTQGHGRADHLKKTPPVL